MKDANKCQETACQLCFLLFDIRTVCKNRFLFIIPKSKVKRSPGEEVDKFLLKNNNNHIRKPYREIYKCSGIDRKEMTAIKKNIVSFRENCERIHFFPIAKFWLGLFVLYINQWFEPEAFLILFYQNKSKACVLIKKKCVNSVLFQESFLPLGLFLLAFFCYKKQIIWLLQIRKLLGRFISLFRY